MCSGVATLNCVLLNKRIYLATLTLMVQGRNEAHCACPRVPPQPKTTHLNLFKVITSPVSAAQHLLSEINPLYNISIKI